MRKVLVLLLPVVFFLTTFAARSADKYDDMKRIIGGVFVEKDGTLSNADASAVKKHAQWMQSMMLPIPPDLADETPLRKISLKKLNAAIRQVAEEKGEFSDAIRYLAGLTDIQYVIAVPEEQDIILAGHGEGWTTDKEGNIIGTNTGQPVFVLECFLSVFRLWNSSGKQDIISCAFETKPETDAGLARLNREFSGIDANSAGAYADALEKTFGNIPVVIKGIPATSRFAKMLAAADFKMKQYALGLETPPVPMLPSYAGLISAPPQKPMTQFYLVPNYSTIQYDSKNLTWHLGEVKVQTLTESEFSALHNNPNVKLDRAASNWSGKFEAQFNALAKKQPVFAVLKNNMQLALVCALISQEKLIEKTKCELPMFTDETKLRQLVYPKPEAVPCRSMISKNGYSTIVVCGGVEINPFPVFQKKQLDNKLDKERVPLMKMSGDSWYGK
ncbi:hypothetical protein FACS189419_02660 [Planctomycetales bacterium]|nr:hypothetical protein FACS189419_02660 [Planctomycetales bacterium]